MGERVKDAKCQRCGYKWQTKSKMRYVSCPSCLTKVKVQR